MGKAFKPGKRKRCPALVVSRLPHGQEGKGSGLGASGDGGKSRPEPLLFPALTSLHIRRLNANPWRFLVKI